MALLEAMPERPHAAPEPVLPRVSDTPEWARTALAPAPQLAHLLDNGLEPNSKTTNGTTLLIVATPDAAKIRLVLTRGAELS